MPCACARDWSVICWEILSKPFVHCSAIARLSPNKTQRVTFFTQTNFKGKKDIYKKDLRTMAMANALLWGLRPRSTIPGRRERQGKGHSPMVSTLSLRHTSSSNQRRVEKSNAADAADSSYNGRQNREIVVTFCEENLWIPYDLVSIICLISRIWNVYVVFLLTVTFIYLNVALCWRTTLSNGCYWSEIHTNQWSGQYGSSGERGTTRYAWDTRVVS